MKQSIASNSTILNSFTQCLFAAFVLLWRVSAAAESDPLLSISRDGDGVAINFIGVLQSANSVSGPWLDEPGEPPAKRISSDVAKYYRVKPFELPAAAHFTVNLETGEVAVSPPWGLAAAPESSKKGDPLAAVVFGGSTIGFDSNVVLTQSGDPGEKLLSVSLVNQSGRTVGQQPNGVLDGIKVIFSDFKNLSTPSDLRLQSTVSTFAGTGAVGSGDGPALTATFNRPVGIAKGPDGSFYIADASAHKIRKLSGQQVFTLAGSGTGASVDGIGSAASINLPWAIVYSASANALVIADRNGRRIRLLTLDGRVTTVAGTGAAGGNNGTGDVATFNDPTALAVDGSGAIYVGEYPGQRIRKITLTGGDPRLASSYTVTTWAGSGVAGSADGIGLAAQFKLIFGLAAEQDGTLYVADSVNNKIRRISTQAEVMTIAGTGTSGTLDGSGKVAQFKGPSGIALFNGSIVISDYLANNVRLLTLTPGGSILNAADWQVRTLAGVGTPGATDGSGDVAQFNSPFALIPDDAGNLVVSDYANSKLRKVAPTAGYFPVGIPAATAITEPVQLSNADGVYIFTTPAGATYRPFITYDEMLNPGATSAAQEWAFEVPKGVYGFEFNVTVMAPTDTKVPLADASNPGPTGVGSSDVLVSTIAGNNLSGYVNGRGSAARFNAAQGVAVDAEGNIFVADSNNYAVRRINTDGVVTTIAGGLNHTSGFVNGRGDVAKFSFIYGIAVTPDGQTVYVADSGNNAIRRLVFTGPDPAAPSSWNVGTIAGINAAAYVDNTDGATARFSGPYGLAWTPGDTIYVSEMNGNRVRRIQPQGGDLQLASSWYVSLVAGDTTSPNGLSASTDGHANQARFSNPAHIAVDRAGFIYVADENNYRVRKIDPNDDVTTLAGSVFGYADGTGGGAMFGQLLSIAVDSAGYVYVGESNQRIRRISPAGVVTTVAGTGGSFPGDLDGTGDVATFYYPTGIAVDAAGTLYLCTGGTYMFSGGGGVSSPGTRIRMIQRILR